MQVHAASLDDADAIARVYVETWLAAYRGILPEAYLAALSTERLARTFRAWIRAHEHVVLVARDRARAGDGDGDRDGDREGNRVVVGGGDDVVGFASGGPESNGDPFFRGELFTLYVAPHAQGQGIGSSLVDEMRARLPWSPILVWVLDENVAGRAFYDKSGAVPVRRRRELIGGRDVAIVGYAWFDAGA